jgi:hypothetical protein
MPSANDMIKLAQLVFGRYSAPIGLDIDYLASTYRDL